MTLKPDYLRAFFKTFLFFVIIVVIFSGVLPYAFGKNVKLVELFIRAIFAGFFLGFGSIVMFTPNEITYTENSFIIKARFFGSGEFSWKQLEGYSAFGKYYGTFLIKFEGRQAFQMVPFGFLPNEWKEFQAMLRDRFPEKKTWLWLGPIPIRFGKK